MKKWKCNLKIVYSKQTVHMHTYCDLVFILSMQQVKYYCEKHPVLNYTLKVTNILMSEAWSFSLQAEDSITVNNLTDDALYRFEFIARSDTRGCMVVLVGE